MDHLACYLPGNLALGVGEGAVRGAKAQLYASVAANLTYTCWQMYERMATGQPSTVLNDLLCSITLRSSCFVSVPTHAQPIQLKSCSIRACSYIFECVDSAKGISCHTVTRPLCASESVKTQGTGTAPKCSIFIGKSLASLFGDNIGLAPEAVTFNPVLGMTVEKDSSKNQLRPETVESLYYMWRLTGERKYRDWGWAIFQAFQKHSKGKTGYHSISVRPLQPSFSFSNIPNHSLVIHESCRLACMQLSDTLLIFLLLC